MSAFGKWLYPPRGLLYIVQFGVGGAAPTMFLYFLPTLPGRAPSYHSCSSMWDASQQWPLVLFSGLWSDPGTYSLKSLLPILMYLFVSCPSKVVTDKSPICQCLWSFAGMYWAPYWVPRISFSYCFWSFSKWVILPWGSLLTPGILLGFHTSLRTCLLFWIHSFTDSLITW